MNDTKTVDGITVDTESVVQFINLCEKEEWSEKDLDRFVSTQGMQYLIQQEKESGPNVDEETVKTYLKKVNQGVLEPEECKGWETALKEKTRIQKRLEYIFSRWNYLVERPFAVVTDYLREPVREGTLYFLPGGGKESYSDGNGFALNLGYGTKMDTHFMFLIAWEGYHYCLTRFMGEPPSVTQCQTPLECVEAFLHMTHREGMALFVGLHAAGTEEQFYQKYMDTPTIKDVYGNAFQLALEGRTQVDHIQNVFSGYTSPAALLGSHMAKALHESDKIMGHTMGKDMLLGSIGEMGFVSFFEIYKPYETDSSLFSDVVWEAFEMVKKERGFGSAGERYYFP